MTRQKIDRNGNLYTFLYATALVIAVATLLSLCATWLKPFQQQNIDSATKIQILNTIGIDAPTNQNAQEFAPKAFDQYIADRRAINTSGEVIDGTDSFVINLEVEQSKAPNQQQLPMFKAIDSKGSTKYIIPIRGKGLWGGIWGYIAINDDLKTICGAKFDHKSETPGLGSEITSAHFQNQFIGKQIFDSNNKFTSILVVKGGAKVDDKHAVDAISGATTTSHGVENMLFDCLKLYQPFFVKIHKERIKAEQEAIRTAFVADSIARAQLEAEEAAKEKALRAYRRRQRAIRDSIAAVQTTTDTTIAN